MLKGAIFDHDGTMFDTEVIWQANWQKAAKKRDVILEDHFKYEICGTSGQMMRDVVAKHYHTEDPQSIIDEVKAGVKHDEEIHLDEKEGLQEIIKMFHEAGVKMAVASSSPAYMLEKNLKNDGIDCYFDAVISGDMVEHGKPAPDIFLLAAEKLGLDIKDCYVFEDAYNGVEAGHASGAVTVMIPDLVQPNDRMKEIADGIYSSLVEARDAIVDGKI